VAQLDLARMARDDYPGRTGDIELVPTPPDFVAGPGGAVTHEGIETNLQHIPLLLFGPGYVSRGATRYRVVTEAAIAPTIARLVGFAPRSWFPEEAPLTEALKDPPATPSPPRLVITVVWEGVGRNVLAKWPDSWPNLQQLRRRGTWYQKANAGTSPTAGAALQATIGTGVFPRTHGIVGDSFRLGRRIVPAWSNGASELHAPTLADLYDRSRGNRPLVGLVAPDSAGLGLVGHGASLSGADRDIVAIQSPGRPGRWGVPNAPWSRDYRAPRSLSSPSGETGTVQRLVRDQHFGADGVPDLLFVSYGTAEAAETQWGMGSVQVGDAIRSLDRQLLTLRSFLNRDVGKGRWVLILTADHGARANPKYTGAYAIDPARLQADIQRRFGGGAGHPSVVQAVGPTQIWIDTKRLSARGYTLYDVSRFLLDYTIADNSTKLAEGGDQRVFQAAFPTALLPVLPCLGS
jgi:hypothetical protein